MDVEARLKRSRMGAGSMHDPTNPTPTCGTHLNSNARTGAIGTQARALNNQQQAHSPHWSDPEAAGAGAALFSPSLFTKRASTPEARALRTLRSSSDLSPAVGKPRASRMRRSCRKLKPLTGSCCGRHGGCGGYVWYGTRHGALVLVLLPACSLPTVYLDRLHHCVTFFRT